MKKKLGEDDCRGCGINLNGKRIDKRRLCLSCSREKGRLENRKHYHKYHPSAIFYKSGQVRKWSSEGKK
jgi:hypothetical protein